MTVLMQQRGDINWRERTHTWFFPLSTRTLVTRPNGIPRWIISASVTSLGMLRMCITLDGFPFWFLSSFTCNQQHKSLKQGWGCLRGLVSLWIVCFGNGHYNSTVSGSILHSVDLRSGQSDNRIRNNS